MTLLNFIPAITAGCFLIMAYLLWVNPSQVNIKANRWLAEFLLCISFLLLDNPLYFSEVIIAHPLYIIISNACLFLSAPTLYFTIEYFVSPERVFLKKDLLHFILFFLVLIFNTIGMFIPHENTVNATKENESIGDVLSLCIIILPLILYWFICFKKLANHKKNLLLFASSTESRSLDWLQKLLIGILVTIIFWGIQISIPKPIIFNFTNIMYLLFAFYVAYYAFKQREVFTDNRANNLELKAIIENYEQPSENAEPDLVKKQILSIEELAKYKLLLVELMKKEQPYLDSELGLLKLAKMIGLSANELSYVINQGFNDNFNGFVNKYRVEQSKVLLISKEHEHLSILGIAFEAGFNSKTAFNVAFKKNVNMSPSEFVKTFKNVNANK